MLSWKISRPSAAGMASFSVLLCLLALPYAGEALGPGPDEGPVDPATILPINLGPAPGCAVSNPNGLNNGAYPGDLVVAGAANCQTGPSTYKYTPHVWRDGAWSKVEIPSDKAAQAESVSDVSPEDPEFTVRELTDMGPGYITKAWTVAGNQSPLELPLPAGKSHIENTVISADGNFIAGSVGSTATQPNSAVFWKRSGDGWQPAEEVGDFEAVSITADGGVIAGNSVDGPWVWTANPAGGGTSVPLGSEPKSIAPDRPQDGSMVVGHRTTACGGGKPPSCTYPIPVYWVKEGSVWVMHDLQALDDVDSEAVAVAEVDGRAIIVGYGYTNQDGGILRPVVWLPATDGSYGEPVRLLALDGGFDTWAEAVDVNRNGLVLGWSEEFSFGPTSAVLWDLTGQAGFQINAGLNDAWYNPATSGQGFFISVFPDIAQVFLAWFTYDTERPPASSAANLGDPGARWLTAFGPYTGGQAALDVELTKGGIFDSPNPQPTQGPDGTITLQFNGCNAGTLSFNIPSIGQQDVIPIQRIADDNIPACESLAGSQANAAQNGAGTSSLTARAANPTPQADDFLMNAGLNDAWYNPATNGQGFFLDVFPDIGKVFLAWFTYDTERPPESTWYDLGEPGHRWLTAFGDYAGDKATLDIEVTEGGVFNSAQPAPTQSLDGKIELEFSDCNSGTLSYEINSINREGVIPIERISLDNVPRCESLDGQP